MQYVSPIKYGDKECYCWPILTPKEMYCYQSTNFMKENFRISKKSRTLAWFFTSLHKFN